MQITSEPMHRVDSQGTGTRRSSLAAVVLLAAAQVAWAAPPTYRVIELPVPPQANLTQGEGINNHGDAVGWFSTLSGETLPLVWHAGAAHPRILSHDSKGEAFSINDSGLIAGAVPGSLAPRAVVWWPSGRMQPLGDLPSGIDLSEAYAINDINQVVGLGTVRPLSPFQSDGRRAVLWTVNPRSLRSLGDLGGGTGNSIAMAVNDAGTVVGSGTTAPPGSPRFDWVTHGFLWRAATGFEDLGDFPGGIDRSEASAVNNLEQVVGVANSDAGQRAFLWNAADGLQDLGILPGFSEYAFAASDINDAGAVVGRYFLGHDGSETDVHSFYWTAADGMIDIAGLVDPSDPQWSRVAGSIRISGINDQGVMVGTILASPVRAVLLVPED